MGTTNYMLNKVFILFVFMLFQVEALAQLKGFVRFNLENKKKCNVYYEVSEDKKNIVFFSEESHKVTKQELEAKTSSFDSEKFGNIVPLKFIIPFEDVTNYIIDSIKFKKTKSDGIPDLELVYRFNKNAKTVTAVVSHFTIFDRKRDDCAVEKKSESFKKNRDLKKVQNLEE